MSNENIDTVLKLVNGEKRYPALNLVRRNPETAAVISKLVVSREPKRMTDDSSAYYGMDQGRMAEISDAIKERVGDAENMAQLFPDLELASQILISSILSPKDMVNTDIIYRLKDNIAPAAVSLKVTEIVARHLEDNYKFKQTLPDLLRAVLIDTGSYIKAIIPESSVDELINGRSVIATESLSELYNQVEGKVSVRHFGILGPTDANMTRSNLGIESFTKSVNSLQLYDCSVRMANEDRTTVDLNLEVSDNYLLLKLPDVIRTNNRNKIMQSIRKRKLSTSTENFTEGQLEMLLYKSNQGKGVPFVRVKTQRNSKRRSVGRPLDMRLPSESTLPVHVPGDPKKHIGYFVMIDDQGNPVTKQSALSAMGGLSSSLNNQSNSLSSLLMSKANKNLMASDKRNLSIDQASSIYAEIVEADLIQRLKNGAYGTDVTVASNTDVYRIMLARSLMNQFTRLIYIPKELVTYFAYKHYDNGVGKSLLDDLKILTSLRSILLFAKVMALTKNSIALTHVNMTIDPNDPDPQKSIEMSIHEIIRMRQQYFPLGINSPTDLVDWIQRAGFEFSFEGHPRIPQTKFDFETKNIQHTVPDSDLDELLRKQTFMAMGLSPETVDNGFSAEFATTVVSNNILLSKRVLQIQEALTPQLTDSGRIICENDTLIREEVIEAIKEMKGSIETYLTDEEKELLKDDEVVFFETYYDTLIANLELDLPKPDITTLENQSQAFEHYSDSLDKALDAWVNGDMLNDLTAGNLGNNVDTIKATLKAFYLRRWMAENGFMNELSDIVATTEDGKAVINMQETMTAHIKGIELTALSYIESLQASKAATNKDLEKLGATEQAESMSSTDSSSSSSDSGDFSMGGMGDDDLNLGGLDDLGNLENIGGDEETTTNTEPETTEDEANKDKPAEPDVGL